MLSLTMALSTRVGISFAAVQNIGCSTLAGWYTFLVATLQEGCSGNRDGAEKILQGVRRDVVLFKKTFNRAGFILTRT